MAKPRTQVYQTQVKEVPYRVKFATEEGVLETINIHTDEKQVLEYM
jgi:hypothetical protein